MKSCFNIVLVHCVTSTKEALYRNQQQLCYPLLLESPITINFQLEMRFCKFTANLRIPIGDTSRDSVFHSLIAEGSNRFGKNV